MITVLKVSLKDYSSLRIGGEGSLVIVHHENEVVEAVKYAKAKGLRLYFIGEGTNTFFGENLVAYLFIKVQILGIVVQKEFEKLFLTAYAGECWNDVVNYAVEHALWGIENLAYIPGTVGAAPVQNIGAYGVQLQDVVTSVYVYDVESYIFLTLMPTDCHFGYRSSLFKELPDRYCIISVTMRLTTVGSPKLSYKPLDTLLGMPNITPRDVQDKVIEVRTSKLPDYKLYPNVGSFFKNPTVSSGTKDSLLKIYQDMPTILVNEGYKIPAAWLIEHIAHAKGVTVRSVGTWPSQPLVIVNYGNSNAEEILSFSQELVKKIEERTGVTLEREVNYIG